MPVRIGLCMLVLACLVLARGAFAQSVGSGVAVSQPEGFRAADFRLDMPFSIWGSQFAVTPHDRKEQGEPRAAGVWLRTVTSVARSGYLAQIVPLAGGRPTPITGLVADARASFSAFCAKMPSVPAEFAETRERAARLLWSAVMPPCGLSRRPSMLMSKNWMNQAWSWDHCFNAMALAYGDADAAWDQLMGMFDHQSPTGQLPNSFSGFEESWLRWGLTSWTENVDKRSAGGKEMKTEKM